MARQGCRCRSRKTIALFQYIASVFFLLSQLGGGPWGNLALASPQEEMLENEPPEGNPSPKILITLPSNMLERAQDLSFSVEVENLPPGTTTPLVLNHHWVRVANNHASNVISTPLVVDIAGKATPIKIADKSPSEAGVFELQCEVVAESNAIWSKLRKRDEPLARERVAFMVFPESFGSFLSPQHETWPIVLTTKPSSHAEWSVAPFFSATTKPLFPSSLSKVHSIDDEAVHAGENISLLAPAQSFETNLTRLRAGKTYALTVRYPSNRPLHLGLEIYVPQKNSTESPPRNTAFFRIADEKLARDQYEDPKSSWHSQTFIYSAHGNDHLRLTNLDPNQFAAIESIVWSEEPNAPISSSPRPQADIASNALVKEARLAAIRLRDLDWIDELSLDDSNRLSTFGYRNETLSLHRLYVAAERLAKYANITRANAVSITVNQGDHALWDTAFAIQHEQPASSPIALEVLLSLFDRTPLRCILEINPMVKSAENKHESILTMCDEVVEIGNRHVCFDSLALSCGVKSDVHPIDPSVEPSADAEETLFQDFAKFSGIEKPSLQETKLLVQGDRGLAIRKWSNERNRSLVDAIANRIGERRLLLCDLPAYAYSLAPNASFVDPAWPSAMSNVLPMVTDHPHHWSSFASQVDTEQRDKQLIVAMRSYAGRVGWSYASDHVTSVTKPVTQDRKLATEFLQSIDSLDPRVILLDWSTLRGAIPHDFPKTLTFFQSLPTEPFREFPSPDPITQLVRMKWGVHEKKLVLTLSNFAPWPCEVDLLCKKAIEWENAIDASSEVIRSSDSLTSTVLLMPGEIKLFRSKGEHSHQDLSNWMSRVQGGNEMLDRIKNEVTVVVEKLGTLSDSNPYPVLSNPSFEFGGGVGVTGWLHAQFPEGSVYLDETEASEGTRSLCLSTSESSLATKTWLVTETIVPPPSGRLAVSLACRGEAAVQSHPHQIRVSIEGTQAGVPFRFSEEVEIPRNGQWQPRKVLAEADMLHPDQVESLRVTIDSLSPGKIWIDDVRLHDLFPTSKERTELQSQAFLAVQGLQKGSLVASAELLSNRWAQYLLNDPKPRVAPVVSDPVNVEQQSPGVAERLKGWLPKPMRF